MKTLIVVLLAVVSTQSIKFPPNFKKCNRKDPDAQKCYLEAAQNGIKQLTKPFPKINLASFHPMEVSELKIGAGSEGVVNVQQNFKNCKLWGIDDIALDEFGFNFDEKYFHAKGFLPELKKVCEYELNGKVLLLPIVGTGSSTVILKNMKVSARFNFEEVSKDNKAFMKFTFQNFSMDPESVSFNFENLFNGDKALGDNINKVLNENNKELFQDVKNGYEEGFGTILVQVFNGLFSKVSIEEAFD